MDDRVILGEVERVHRVLRVLSSQIDRQSQENQIIMSALSNLTNAVRKEKEEGAALLKLVQGLAKKLQDIVNAGNNDPALQALADELSNDDEAIAASVLENTPSDPNNPNPNPATNPATGENIPLVPPAAPAGSGDAGLGNQTTDAPNTPPASPPEVVPGTAPPAEPETPAVPDDAKKPE